MTRVSYALFFFFLAPKETLKKLVFIIMISICKSLGEVTVSVFIPEKENSFKIK